MLCREKATANKKSRKIKQFFPSCKSAVGCLRATIKLTQAIVCQRIYINLSVLTCVASRKACTKQPKKTLVLACAFLNILSLLLALLNKNYGE